MLRDRYYMIDAFLLHKGISLEKIGCKAIAWNFEYISYIIESLTNQNYYILGGDVYLHSKNEIIFTYDSWYYNIKKENVSDETLEESKIEALNYIKMYHEKNKGNYLYCPVFAHRERILYKL